jgi:hypothetical protein
MSVVYAIQDAYIQDVHIGIHNNSNGTHIARAKIVGTTGHGILSSGDRVSISDTFISPRSGNGITLSGGRGGSISNVRIVGGYAGIETGDPLASVSNTSEKLDIIIDRFLGEISKIQDAATDEICEKLSEFKGGKKRTIKAENYNRIVGFMSNHATVLTFAYQFFPVLFGQSAK